jgi:hypothetical protein
MIAKTLNMLIEKQWSSAREMGEICGKAPSTIYRWIQGQSEPDFVSIKLLLRKLGNRSAQQALLAAFLSDTPWQAVRFDHDLDTNSDGHVNAEDALEAAIKTVKLTGESLDVIHCACKHGKVDASDAVDIIALLDEIAEQSQLARRIVAREVERRKKAKLKLAE